jgi:hypothetical protein
MKDRVIKIISARVQSKESLPQSYNLRPASKARQNWEIFFCAMAKHNDHELLDDNLFVLTNWEKSQWQG